jgi:hypothetical protein
VIATALRAGWGTALLVLPDRILRLAGHHPTPSARRVLRVLGARHLAQAIAAWLAHDTRNTRDIGAVVDTAHAASCLVIACGSPSWRRAAATDMVIATALAVDGIRR